MSVGIDPKYLQATIYLYPSASAALDGVSVGGSGFILGVMSPDNSLICRYAVTNKHVIDGGCHVIRTNTPDGSLRIVETAPEAWTCALDDDLAVAEFDGPAAGCIVMDEVFLDEDCNIDGWPIFPGDDVFLYGRLVTHDGQQRNRPVVRFGNISMLPDNDCPVKVGEREQIAFLVECRSLSGFSGSPAFVHLAQPRLTDQRGWIPGGLRFLGVDCAHVPFWSQAREAPHSDAPRISETFVETNTGIAVVIPAWRLRALINDEPLATVRETALRTPTEARKELQVLAQGEFPDNDLRECVSLIASGDAVDPGTAEEHLPHCLFVVVKREGDQIVGVGAIKGQRPNYVRTIARRSGFEFDPQMHELGYVVVRESHRNRGISKAITEKLLALFEHPLFATTSNEHMERTLSQTGFARRGHSWKSHKDEDLHLWMIR
jgi:GNAT superfamily N-acetyltransferase